MSVRLLGPDDGGAWQSVFAAVAEEGRWIGAEAPVLDGSAEIVERYLDQVDRALFLAEVDGRAVGWITVDLDEELVAELGMGVVLAHRRQGIGTAMLDAAIDWARAHGSSRVRLDVFPHNEAAIALYQGFGFVEVARQVQAWRRRNGERWDLLAMERTL